MGDIIIVVSSKPTITIDLEKDQRCTLVGLKMSHSGNTDDQDDADDKDMLFDEGLVG